MSWLLALSLVCWSLITTNAVDPMTRRSITAMIAKFHLLGVDNIVLMGFSNCIL